MSSAALHKPVIRERVTAKNAKDVLASQGVLKVYGLGILAALLVVILGVFNERIIGLVDSPIERFEVSGAFAQLDQSELSAVLEPLMGQSFLSVDIALIQTQLETLAWVDSAVVKRQWPNTIAVTVTEQVAVANWGHNAYINNDGDVFEPAIVISDETRPLFIGPEQAAQRERLEMLSYLSEIQSLLAVHGASADQLVLNERGAWKVGLLNGPIIELGSEPGIKRLQRALKVYYGFEAEAKNAVEKIDARYTNGVAVRWKELEVAAGYEYSSVRLQKYK